MLESAQNPKLLVVTALITAMTTIGVTFIGVFPQIRSSDNTKLQQLETEILTLKKGAKSNGTPPTAAAQDKPMKISGTVKSENGSFLKGHEIYLLPEGTNMLTARTDDKGKFTCQTVPQGTYSIIVRDSASGLSGRGLLDDDEGEVKVIGG